MVECKTSVRHRLSEKTLDTSGAVKRVSALDICKSEAMLQGTSKEKLAADLTRMYSTPANSRRLAPYKPREPVWTETSDNRYQHRNKLHEEIGKYCEQSVGAIEMNSIYEADLFLRISTFFNDQFFWSRMLTQRRSQTAARNTKHIPQPLHQRTVPAMWTCVAWRPTEEAQGQVARLASCAWLESLAMFHREVVEDIFGDDGLRMMEGAMESLVEEQAASSSDDVVDENSRNTSDEDNGETHVTDATPSSSSP